MCYSAQIKEEYDKYVRAFGARMSLEDYTRIFWERRQGAKHKIPRAIELDFLRHEAKTDAGQEIQRLIREYDAAEIAKLEQEVFKQRKRNADAARTLQTKTTKKAQEDLRISGEKVDWALRKLGDLKRSETKNRDRRIFPGWYTHVMVSEGGKRVIKPMRYQCRPEGAPSNYDIRFPGTYNARRDNLDKFWRRHWGHKHGIMIADAFFENVAKHTAEGRELAEGEKEENAILEFKPRGMGDMLVACLWSEWIEGDERLLSFAAITDEPPDEIRAAGHDRCIIPIRPENLDAWLNPDLSNLAAQSAILDDRERPYYEHRMAA